MLLSLSLLAFAFGLGWTMYDDPLTIKGYVRDAETQEPLIGATILIKGTNNGALTDINGFYQLRVPDEQKSGTLVVSFIGYRQQEFPIKNRNRIDVNLQQSIVTLDEAVVTSATTTRTRTKKARKPRRDKSLREADMLKSSSPPPPPPPLSVSKDEESVESDHYYEAPVSPPPPASAALPNAGAPSPAPKVRIKPNQQPTDASKDNSWKSIDYKSPIDRPVEDFNREGYSPITENQFLAVIDQPLSTFSIDVDRASYANMRRFLNSNQLPPRDAIRIEEMVNYFHYDYEDPQTVHPFNIVTEMSACPWAEDHHLLHVALKGKEINMEEAPASNLVFLVDVSGSMSSYNKLPLLKQSFNLLVNNLRPQDRVAIVVYAGAAGEVLPSTSGSERQKILNALNRLQSGGSTAGGAGIRLAYRIAKQNFIPQGNNRVILATDGDFNVGESSDAAMQELIEEKRKQGVFLTVLGFGTGNYQDAKMEILADKGNGNYAYIDNLLEAEKVMVNEMSGTLYTIAKDVKLQLEFNPNKVKAYRLIGYENRVLAKEDFNDDTKDAGELGAGHTVTALYEIVPAHSQEKLTGKVDPLKYQAHQQVSGDYDDEWLTVKFRYKQPDADKSQLIEHVYAGGIAPVADASQNLRFASAVAEFGMLLRNSAFKGGANYQSVINRAKGAMGEDSEGYRVEFIQLVKKARILSPANEGGPVAEND